ncbi:hypothetical protein, partial [Niveibacterium sp.]|uniref:hypothetical protein n=1 Tax=Niveibacterium sp. TaxID=2017444 RepID=UPI0035AEB196
GGSIFNDRTGSVLGDRQQRERQANEQAAQAEPFEHPLHAYPWADVIKSVPRFSGIDGVRLMSFEHSVAERRSRYTLEVADERALAALVDLVGPKSANPVRIVEQHQVEAGGQRHFQLVLEADGKPAR